MSRILRSRSERALLGTAIGLLALVALSEVYEVAFAAPRDALAREERALERELTRLAVLDERSDVIRARYATLSQDDRERRALPPNSGEILARLEALAQGQVALVEVQPYEAARGSGTPLSLKFEGSRAPIGRFVERMIRELRGNVLSLEASVDPQGTVRCQARVVFGGLS